MAKFYGVVGYADSVEVEPGVWEEQITERAYYGDTIRNTRRLQNSGGVNDDVVFSNQISIVADPYAYDHFSSIRYVEFTGAKWKVTDIEVQRPRLILTVGGVYNGKQATTAI
jgi:hypothetical protein